MSGYDWERIPDSGSEDEEGEGETYIVEQILLKRTIWSGTEYLIKWQGYPESDNTWEPASNLQCQELLDEFERNWAKEREAPTTPKKTIPDAAADSPSTSSDLSAEANEKPLDSTGANNSTHMTAKRSATASPVGATNETSVTVSDLRTVAIASTTKKPRFETVVKPRIEQIIEDGKRREILEAAEKRLKEEQQRGLPDSATFERMKARKDAIEKAQEKVEREGGFNPALSWKI